MSVQSDNEMLAVQAMELYARSQNLSTGAAYDLFQQHQIFEKMVLQYEYLHQVSLEEVLEFVSAEMERGSKELIVYHGTVEDFLEIDLDKSHDRRDFGRGFYTTILEGQAKEWAYRLHLRKRTSKHYLMRFAFQENNDLSVKRFYAMDTEWLDFIKENRSKGGVQHSYDVVIGPVADDDTMETVQLYLAGILKPEEAVERLRYSKVNNQVSFHTKRSLQSLMFLGREVYA